MAEQNDEKNPNLDLSKRLEERFRLETQIWKLVAGAVLQTKTIQKSSISDSSKASLLGKIITETSSEIVDLFYQEEV